jgi:sugar lactone lactonase YvrE
VRLSILGALFLVLMVAAGGVLAQTCGGARIHDFSVFSGQPAGSVTGLDMPGGVAVDQDGNVFVADTANHVIRMITTDGVIFTYAGLPGIAGSTDGVGADARFNNPRGIYVDSVNLVYVADFGNHTIRRIDSNRNVVTIAGTAGVAGEKDGLGTEAQFNGPVGIIADLGDVVVTDVLGHTIRYISPQLQVSTVGGQPNSPGHVDGLFSNSKFDTPTGVAVDLSGNVWIADSGNHVIRGISIDSGLVFTAAGMPGEAGAQDGSSANARFDTPTAVAADLAGRVYILDTGNFTIRRAVPDGAVLNVTTLAGAAGMSGYVDAPTGSAARFEMPSDLAAALSGELFVTERAAGTVRKIETSGATSTFVGGGPPPGSVDGPAGVATFARPGGAAIDTSGNVYVADRSTHVVRRIAPDGSVSTIAGMAGESGTANGSGAAARFDGPGGVAVDASGNVYVADTGNHSIRKVTPAGAASTFAGQSGTSGSSDGTGSAARFNAPEQLAFDAQGNLYVTDAGNSTIRKITTTGAVTTIAGMAGVSGTADGIGPAARFERPVGVASAADGSLFVSDGTAHTIRRIAPNGAVTTVAGKAGESGFSGGIGGDARFDAPAGLAVDSSGNVWIADSGNQTVRRLSLSGHVTTVGGQVRHMAIEDGLGPVARFAGPVSVVAGPEDSLVVVSGTSGVVHKGLPVTPLCLENDRFVLSLQAKDPRSDNTGLGLAIPQSDIFGYFAIPGLTSNPENPEVFVKVLDGRVENGNFWVFYGGLTDFEIDLVVMDLIGGENRVYHKEGRNFCGGADTAAFHDPNDSLMPKSFARSHEPPRLTAVPDAGCGVDALCLFSERFTVTLEAKDPRTGNTGVGAPIPQSDLFGYFSIPDLTFDPGNPEVFVKVLDGRIENGRFWVFYGGLTDFALTLTVTDTSNGTSKTYTKEGGSFCGGADVLAFF